MKTTIQLRRGTASQWTSANSILNAGEIGIESDTSKFKIGNGSTAWSLLSYSGDVTLTETQTLTNKTLTAPTLTGTVTVPGDINLSAAGGPGSVIDELTLLLMNAI